MIHAKLSWEGVLAWLSATRPNLGAVQRDLIAYLVNVDERHVSVPELAKHVGIERLAAEALLIPFASRGDLRISSYAGGQTDVTAVSPLLRRELA